MLYIEDNKLVLREENVAIPDHFATVLHSRAEKMYKSGRFRCAEAVVRAFIDVTDQKQLRPLVAMASGFGVGMENSRSLCGALAGGVLVLGMLFGRDKPGDVKVDRCQKLAGELHDVFVKKHGSAICCALVEGLADGSPEREERCALYCADAAAMLGTIVEREWFSGACCQIGGH